MAVEAVRNGQRVTVVPVRYLSRPGTVTKLNPFQDGLRIFSTIYRLAKMNNPIFYFGIIGLFISLAGGASSASMSFSSGSRTSSTSRSPSSRSF